MRPAKNPLRQKSVNVLECQCGVAPSCRQIKLLWFSRFKPSTFQPVLRLCVNHVLRVSSAPMHSLTNAQIRELKARAQLMKPTLKVGHDGLSPEFIAALAEALDRHELVKV